MNIERSFVFAFKAPQAVKKLALGGVFSMLFFTVFFAFAVVGYVMRVLCDALEGRDAKLPEWSDLGSLFNEGLLPVLILLGYGSPLIALCLVEQILHAIIGWNFGIIAIFLIVRLLVVLPISLLLPLALIRFAIKGTLRSAFDFGHIITFIKTNPGNYFTAWGLALVVGIAAGMTGFVLLVVGIFFTSFVANVITFHLYAQAYRASTPFPDDKDGKLRSSMAIPPPLR